MLSQFYIALNSSFCLSLILFGGGIDASIGRGEASLEGFVSRIKRPRLSGQFGARPLPPEYPLPKSEELSITNPQTEDPPSGSGVGCLPTQSDNTQGEREKLYDTLRQRFSEAAYPFIEIRVDQLDENWAKNHEKVVSLHNDFEELSDLREELYTDWRKYVNTMPQSELKTMVNEEFIEAFKIGGLLQEKITILNDVKLLQLGNLDDDTAYKKVADQLLPGIHQHQKWQSPLGKLRVTTQKALHNYGASVLDDVKRLLVQSDLHFQGATVKIDFPVNQLESRTQKYGDRVIAFLFKNKLIDNERIPEFFEDSMVRRHFQSRGSRRP
ncbi:hypothetical protein PtA15_16A258 [Puccinia triticina]|uniref:Uncharacterized protein n=1 Tax=Puccinia triticina TaxID=208348 RepID=A0ABY7DBM9_9BASI|nr:uncharacterized protein PtA15_16A258 [Puccinia triticina]WAQ92352.1 hypothetical protein PtA15_16A258 [Puccinia triticina]